MKMHILLKNGMINENEIIIFETKDKSIALPVRIENESVWLNRNQMAELFERDVKTIGKHIIETKWQNYLNAMLKPLESISIMP